MEVKSLVHCSNKMLVLHPVQQTSSSQRNQLKQLLNFYQVFLSASEDMKFGREKCMNEQLAPIDSVNNSMYCLIVVEYVSKLDLSVLSHCMYSIGA